MPEAAPQKQGPHAAGPVAPGAIPHGVAGPHHPALMHHFDDLEQQKEAASLGMWVFLATEVLFFGGLFATYMVYRIWYPEVFGEASRHLDLTLGALNTAVLICSSLTMAIAVHASAIGRRGTLMLMLVLTMALGSVFLGIKGYEYYTKWVEHLIPGPGFRFEHGDAMHAQIFYSLYFAMTGLHATHMVIGLGILSGILFMAWRGRFTPEWNTPVEVTGLYWHFVDIVWIFLFPLLYLVDRHS
ncbi:MAG: cytochrome c oxidase subunit 3 family protein [Vicinamibacterales bacterium]